jgi:ABC-type lipoprotein release transport system permease subunit
VIELMGGLPVLVNGSEQSVLMHIFFRPELIVIVSCLALFSLVAVLAAIPPSRRASKIAITDALRWI